MLLFLDHRRKAPPQANSGGPCFCGIKHITTPLCCTQRRAQLQIEEAIDAAMKYTNFNDIPLLLSVDQLTEVLGIGRNTAYQLVRSEKIKSIRIGRIIRIPRENIKEFFM